MAKQTPGKEKKGRKQRQYDVDVVRTGYANMTIRVMASSAKQAKELALEEAGNHVFSEHDADYTAEYALPIKEN